MVAFRRLLPLASVARLRSEWRVEPLPAAILNFLRLGRRRRRRRSIQLGGGGGRRNRLLVGRDAPTFAHK